MWIGFVWFMLGSSDAPCEHNNELLGSINCREFLNWFSDHQLLKKDSVPREIMMA